MICGPKNWAEWLEGAFSSIFICEGFGRWVLTDMASFTRLYFPGVEDNMEWWVIYFTRSQALWIEGHIIFITESVISQTSLDLNCKVWKMPNRNMRPIQWFSNFILPRTCLWNISLLSSYFEKVWSNNEKNHHHYLESVIINELAISQQNAVIAWDNSG